MTDKQHLGLGSVSKAHTGSVTFVQRFDSALWTCSPSARGSPRCAWWTGVWRDPMSRTPFAGASMGTPSFLARATNFLDLAVAVVQRMIALEKTASIPSR